MELVDVRLAEHVVVSPPGNRQVDEITTSHGQTTWVSFLWSVINNKSGVLHDNVVTWDDVICARVTTKMVLMPGVLEAVVPCWVRLPNSLLNAHAQRF